MELVGISRVGSKKVVIELRRLEVIEIIRALEKYSYSKDIGELERKKIVEMKAELSGIMGVIERLPKTILIGSVSSKTDKKEMNNEDTSRA